MGIETERKWLLDSTAVIRLMAQSNVVVQDISIITQKYFDTDILGRNSVEMRVRSITPEDNTTPTQYYLGTKVKHASSTNKANIRKEHEDRIRPDVAESIMTDPVLIYKRYTLEILSRISRSITAELKVIADNPLDADTPLCFLEVEFSTGEDAVVFSLEDYLEVDQSFYSTHIREVTSNPEFDSKSLYDRLVSDIVASNTKSSCTAEFD